VVDQQVQLFGYSSQSTKIISTIIVLDSTTMQQTDSKVNNTNRGYLVIKKPIEKSIFYQHSKQGMKYWYEEKKPVSYQSKIALGRKGTLLGLVDSPYK